MNRTMTFPLADELAAPASRRDAVLGWAAGFGFTFALFLGLAHIENFGPDQPPAPIEDLRAVAFPLEAPPPPPRRDEPVVTPEPALPFAGIDVGASDSPVRITVVAPDLEALIPATREAPRAVMQPGYLPTEFKPRLDTALEERRIYQVSEVDQLPTAILRVAPAVPGSLFDQTGMLHVVLLVVIDKDGSVASVRLGRSSGQPVFDEAAMETVRTRWEFTPAIRRGKKVRCLAQQSVRVRLAGGSRFELP